MNSDVPPGRRSSHPAPRPRKSSEAEIEREIGNARARIGRTLEALACRLAPQRLLQQGSQMFSRWFGARGGGDVSLDRFGLGLIGAGIAWVVVVNSGLLRRRGEVRTGGAEDGEEIGDGDDDTSEHAGAARERGDQDRGRPSDATEPLLFALLGFAAGAAVALLLPPGRREQRAVAAAREDLWRKAEALGHELAARIRSLGPVAAQAQSPVREGEER